MMRVNQKDWLFGSRAKKGRGRPLVLRVLFPLHMDHPLPEPDAVRDGKQEVELHQRPKIKQAWRRGVVVKRNHLHDACAHRKERGKQKHQHAGAKHHGTVK